MSELNFNKTKGLGDVKSIYIKKEIFTFLDEQQKFELIIYNKYLQKEFGVNIEDYKRLSGIYKNGKRNGHGKEYLLDSNILIFEGEYLNGKRNGKRKEYFDNVL